MRRSKRGTRNQHNMEEVGLENIYRSSSDEPLRNVAPRAVGALEQFKRLDTESVFHRRHCPFCDTCGRPFNASNAVYCQGCSLSYHQTCLGPRSARDHFVTKIGAGDFVLQCRRCVNTVKRKEKTAPNMAMCQVCRAINPSCVPFKVRKTALQEQKDREDNSGEDPSYHVKPGLVNNGKNVLFRCTSCWRGFHYHHLPPRSQSAMELEDEDEIANQRYDQYKDGWTCLDCSNIPAKVAGIVAWRPLHIENYTPGHSVETVNEDDKEYLVRWDRLSHFRAKWMSGAWTWGVTAVTTRRAFVKRETGPKLTFEDAVPEEYLRIDIVLDVRYSSYVDISTEEVDKARIKEVQKAYVKYKGLGYEDAVWETVPSPEDGDRWTDYVSAYNEWVMRRYVQAPKQEPLLARLAKLREMPFTKLEKSQQPETLVGGELMKYQLDGLNWLYYRWYSKQNAILADEMGLGKTIQVIGLMATLATDHKCFPFLVVVPNSTCPNWRREIKRWCPSLRVVTYYGSASSRRLCHDYEMFPEGSKTLRSHVVVTSYDAAAEEATSKTFRNISWAGLIVDEGQRLKNDRGLLYTALNSLQIPYKLLMTGRSSAGLFGSRDNLTLFA